MKKQMNFKKLNYYRMAQIALCVMGMAMVSNIFGIGCGQGFKASTSGKVDGQTDNFSVIPSDPTVIMTGVKAAAVPMLSQSYASLAGALQLATPSAASRTEYLNQLTNLSESGRPATVGASFSVAITSLAAQLCLDKINAEAPLAAAQKTIFNAVNLNAAPAGNLTDAAIQDVVNRLARAFWQRNETANELAMLTRGVKESMDADAANNATETREAGLYLCTAMAVSQSGLEL